MLDGILHVKPLTMSMYLLSILVCHSFNLNVLDVLGFRGESRARPWLKLGKSESGAGTQCGISVESHGDAFRR